ncbi:MAG TPA: hypothetical protein VMH81_14215 [Bryobacteraceae bacterium]|nr:hypothetical protein [Bryobacteraceae bacterium]
MSLPEIKPAHLCFTDDRYEAVTERNSAEALVRAYRGDSSAMHRLRELLAQTDQDVFRRDDNTVLALAAGKLVKGELRVKKDPCERKSEKNRRYLDWILKYGYDTIDIAASLRTTIPNILGLAAVESDFGRNKYAVFANNFFKLTASREEPLPGQMGLLMDGADPKVGMAKFKDYLSSARAFAKTKGQFIVGETNPERFVSILQDRAKFGTDARSRPLPKYAEDLAEVIHDMAIRMNCQ